MLTWLITNRIAAFEKIYDDDPTCAREILAAGPRAPGAIAGATIPVVPPSDRTSRAPSLARPSGRAGARGSDAGALA